MHVEERRSNMARKPEEERRADLIAATIHEIAAAGSLNVTTSQIAKRAGVSPGLAFHYFEDKEGLFLAAMRSVLTAYSTDVKTAYRTAASPNERLEAIAKASFGMTSARKTAIAAWVNFYVLALQSEPARKLLAIYHRRLSSNLIYALKPKAGAAAPAIANRIAGLIDGLYLRHALNTTSDTDLAKHVVHAIEAEYAVLENQP